MRCVLLRLGPWLGDRYSGLEAPRRSHNRKPGSTFQHARAVGRWTRHELDEYAPAPHSLSSSGTQEVLRRHRRTSYRSLLRMVSEIYIHLFRNMLKQRSRLEVGHYVQGVPGMIYRVFDEEARAVYIFNEARISDKVRVVPDCQLGHRLPVRDISAPHNIQAVTSISGQVD